MFNEIYYYLDKFFYEVNLTAFLTCAAAFSIMLVLWGVLYLAESSGYMSKFIGGVRKTKRFLDRHLIITDYNVDEFYEKCIKKMPSPYISGWKNYFSKRDGNTAAYFQKAVDKRTVDYANSATVIAYRLVSFFMVIIAVGLCYYYGVSTLSCIFILVSFTAMYVLLSSILRLKQYLNELKFNRKNDEFVYLIDSFSKFKSQLVPLSHKLNAEKQSAPQVVQAVDTKLQMQNAATTIANK